ncbi:MAG: hypothetical protein AB7E79_12450 [Rhodospirillaceae bacterium]
MPNMPPYKLALYQKAEGERRRCQEWLTRIMRASPTKTRSKDDLRVEAMRDLKVSKNSFDSAWIGAIEELGYHNWYEPLRKGRRRNRQRLNEPV